MSDIDPKKPSFSKYRTPHYPEFEEEGITTRTEPSFSMENDTPRQGGQQPQAQDDIMQQLLLTMTQILAKQQRDDTGFTIKLPTPERYDGTRSTKVIENWLASVEKYLRLSQYKYTPDLWPTYASSLFTGNAATWWRRLEAAKVTIESWEQFKHKVLEEFRPRNAQRAARDRLAALTMTSTVSEYLNEFQDLWLEIPTMTEDEAYDRFWRNLAPKVHTDVMKPDHPATFDELAQRALSWEAAEATEQAITNGLPRPETRVSPSIVSPANNGVAPMDLDVLRSQHSTHSQGWYNSGGTHLGGYTSMPQATQGTYSHGGPQGLYYHEHHQGPGLFYHGNRPQRRFQQQVTNGPTCFQCGGRGHMARVCPSGRKNSGKGQARRV